MTKSYIFGIGLFLTGCVLFWISCIKNDFDKPPDTSQYDPHLTVTTTISTLKKMPQGLAITDDIIIEGTVIMNDKSRNYFKKIVIRDASGGIAINIDQTNLYNDYPVGRKIYVRCKGLFLGNFHQNKELGYSPDANGLLSGIPFPLLDKFVIKANYPNFYKVDTLTINQLSSPNAASKYLNTLVTLKDVEFSAGSAGVPYAQEANISSSTDLAVEDCEGNTITLTNSGYATFQPYFTPIGKGTLVGLYTRYNNTPKIIIRDTSDITFSDHRCNGSPIEPATIISIDSLRERFHGTSQTLAALRIRGIVISDVINGNQIGGTIVFQGGNMDRGIVLSYGGQPQYELGDSLVIDITGCTLGLSINGALEVEGVRTDKTIKLGVQKNIQPKDVDIATILTHKDEFESTLIRLSGLSYPNQITNYFGINGGIPFSDGTGTITHYCNSTSSFKDLVLPPSPITSITGYIEIHGLYAQIRIRYPQTPLNDVIP